MVEQTPPQSSMPDRVDSALRWRCRRGMLELDIMLKQFVDSQYVLLDAKQKNSFDLLLDYPDQLLFDLFLGHMQSSDNNVSELVQTIRQSTAV
ncbi:Succinate dehydrogenase flavin-adding protein, antitoxin of CptAB toxin-antitoxin [hydrothermal vent metagenome]|uniref:Succinate dehydrogenase flavin-adding protein, antitoxin of CptAB toxin-antitoxin n=1 Tax=hydrothermal vent metagenome TaxID=652676 RepID=A0A3B0XNQ2_9ZZZZ